MKISELWRTADSVNWEQALEHYWTFVLPQNVELERALGDLKLQSLECLTPTEWYNFLHDKYFRWKYTAKNGYATTTAQLKKYIELNELHELDEIRQQLLTLKADDIRGELKTAARIRGLAIAGASGLLSLMYPEVYATVDQFVVKALREVEDLSEREALEKLNPENLDLTDGVVLTGILIRKAKGNNQRFATSDWTPRKVDVVLWTYGR